MARKHVRAIAQKLIPQLPEIPEPWDVEELCRVLAERRGRPLTLHPVDLPAMPFGVWYGDAECDHIFYRSSVTGYYRDHIVLHEICHMLAGHGVAPADLTAAAGAPGTELRGQRTKGLTCNNTEEEIAETFAAMVLKKAGRRRPPGTSAVESRARELFGATSA